MTEPSSDTRREPARRPRFLSTALASVACFLVAFEFLAFQLSSGHDPSLGSQAAATVAAKRPTVIDRRVIATRVVHDPPKSTATPTAAVPATSSAATVAPAPAPAPVAAPAPAPAPAPAAPVTSSS